MKKSITRILVPIIIALIYVIVYFALEYHHYKDRYETLQYYVDAHFLDAIKDIDIKVSNNASDEEMCRTYIIASEELMSSLSLYSMTSYEKERINTPNSKDGINMDLTLMKISLYLKGKASKNERIEPELAKFITESLNNIAENMDNPDECQKYINDLLEKLN